MKIPDAPTPPLTFPGLPPRPVPLRAPTRTATPHGRIVAKISTPTPIKGIMKTMKGLEKMFGPGLVILLDGDPDWMNIAQPIQASQASE